MTKKGQKDARYDPKQFRGSAPKPQAVLNGNCTPGPWSVRRMGKEGAEWEGAWEICGTNDDTSENSPYRGEHFHIGLVAIDCEADARLMAAAPRLLEKLREYRKQVVYTLETRQEFTLLGPVDHPHIAARDEQISKGKKVLEGIDALIAEIEG